MNATDLSFKNVATGTVLTVNHKSDVWILTFGEKTGKNNQYWAVTATCNGVEKYKNAAKTVGDWKSIITGEKNKTNRTVGAGSFEKTFRKLQAQLAAATTAFAEFQLNNSIITLADAQEADKEAAAKKQANSKRAKKQAARRTEDTLLSRIKVLRRWAKQTNRLILFQQLTDKMFEITE